MQWQWVDTIVNSVLIDSYVPLGLPAVGRVDQGRQDQDQDQDQVGSGAAPFPP